MSNDVMFDFKVNIRDEKNPEFIKLDFLCNKEGKPIKIGDGTFGAVFKVKGGLKLYAVKILYNNSSTSIKYDNSGTMIVDDQDVAFQAAKERFDHECKAMLYIREALVAEGVGAKVIGSIVEHIGYTDKFPIKQELTSTQGDGDIALSPYALVLDYYHGTVKDLLENKNDKTSGLSGYELLREIAFQERIRMILPFLRGIASGLNTMHKAGYVHLDIKPANIFWQNVDGEIKAAIGDLGYIKSFRNSDQEPVRSESQAALGTLHYRSPEQKDFQDTCEVEILKGNENEDFIRLRTADPKFSDTIIEAGDNLLFLNNVIRNFKIKSIKNNKSITTIDILKPTPLYDLEPDKGTQVKIFKNQGVRTDIFGFGAIAYDLITCGKSPERFYSYLAMYDLKDSKNAKNESVQTIIDNYVDNIEIRSKRSSIYSSVFEHFHDHETHQSVPSEIVSLILKCMLYHLQGTYYDEKGDAAFEAIKDDLLKLNDEYRGITEVNRNVLTSGERLRNDAHSDTQVCELRRYVDEIQSFGVGNKSQSSLLTRIFYAALRFDRLVDLVIDHKMEILEQDVEKYDYSKETGENPTKLFFAELTPELVSVVNGNQLEFKSTVYKTMTQYISDLWENRISGKLIHYPLEPFSPYDILGDIKRKIELCNTGNSNKNEYRYKFLEASLLGDNIKPGDWIVVHQKEVRRIKSINRDIVELYSPIKIKETIPETNSGTDPQTTPFETGDTISKTGSVTDSQAISSGTDDTISQTSSVTDSQAISSGTDDTISQTSSDTDSQAIPSGTDDTVSQTGSVTDSQAISSGTNDTISQTDSVTEFQAISSGTDDTISKTNSVTDPEKQSCFDDNNTEFYYYRNLDPMLYYVSMLGEYIYQLFFVGLGNNSISTPKSVHSVKAQLESSPSIQKDFWVVLKKSLDTKAYSQGRDITERVSILFRRLTALYLGLSLTNQKAFLSQYKPSKWATEIDSLRKIWRDIRNDVEECLELAPESIEDYQEEHSELIESQLGSQEMDEQKLQIDFASHFQNILRDNE